MSDSGTKTSQETPISTPTTTNYHVKSWQAGKSEGKCQQAGKLHKIGTRIDKSIADDFRLFVANKHGGQVWRYFSAELEKALMVYMQTSNKQQQETFSSIIRKRKIRGDVASNHEQIRQELRQLTDYPFAHFKTLRDTVNRVLGNVDKRTQKKYLTQVIAQCEQREDEGRYLFDVESYIMESEQIKRQIEEANKPKYGKMEDYL